MATIFLLNALPKKKKKKKNSKESTYFSRIYYYIVIFGVKAMRICSQLDNGSVSTFPQQPNPVTTARDTHATTEELLVLRVLRLTRSK
jgi:hypothetical protein